MPKYEIEFTLNVPCRITVEASTRKDAKESLGYMSFVDLLIHNTVDDQFNEHSIDIERVIEDGEPDQHDEDWSMYDDPDRDFIGDQDPYGDDTPDRDDYNPGGF